MSQLALAATQYVPFDSKKNLNSGDTAWVLAAAALVLLMTPGLAFFYGGMVRAKHILGMLIQNFAAIAVVSVTWILVGFSLAFGGEGKFLGDLHFFGMQNVNDVVPAMGTAQTIPTLAFVAFQVTFAIITPALITGAAADRWKFGAFVAFVTVWSIVIYAPVAHWVFDGYGWLNRSSATGRQVLRGRLRRRNRCPYQRGCRGSGHGARARQAPRLATGEDARQQHPVRHARRRPAVVRLVRIQCRIGADRRQPCVLRLGQHEHGDSDGVARLDHRGEAALREVHGSRRRVRRGRRTGGDHPLRGLRQPDRVDLHRSVRRQSSARLRST